jgi:hypothetical protein
MTKVFVGADQPQPLNLAELWQLRRRLNTRQAVGVLRHAALGLLSQPAYQDWLAVQRYKGLCFQVDENLPEVAVLRDLGLIGDGGYLRVQIHRYWGKLFLTDTPNVSGEIQVYPWNDESDAIVGRVSRNWPDWAQCTVDPMCGAGHHNIVVPGRVSSRVSFDVNQRAVRFTGINAALNDVSVFAATNDIRQGFVQAFEATAVRKDCRILLMINTPFALSPVQAVLPVHSDSACRQ